MSLFLLFYQRDSKFNSKFYSPEILRIRFLANPLPPVFNARHVRNT